MWQGEVEGTLDTWLRWRNVAGSVILTRVELAQRTDTERQRADAAEAKAARLVE